MMKQLLRSLFGATEQGKPRPGCLGEQWGGGRLPQPCPHRARGSVMSHPDQNPPMFCTFAESVTHLPSHPVPSSCFTFSMLHPTAHFLLCQHPSFFCVLCSLETCYPFASGQFFPLSFLSFKEVKFTHATDLRKCFKKEHLGRKDWNYRENLSLTGRGTSLKDHKIRLNMKIWANYVIHWS